MPVIEANDGSQSTVTVNPKRRTFRIVVEQTDDGTIIIAGYRKHILVNNADSTVQKVVSTSSVEVSWSGDLTAGQRTAIGAIAQIVADK